ncbi:MAG TPA: class I SAM-dependent methyltransferase [Thermodesulfobacteriota bacterium]|nr:class I SAM-dependent methyltransferase [Thermodesulfobacteriota bacterium]
MDRRYYDEYYFLERNHWWFRVRASIIMDYLRRIDPKNKTLTILNIGVATGASTEMLNQIGQVTSIEYDKGCAEFTSKELGIPVTSASILDLPFKNNSFDLVCAFDVIEHVEDDQKAVDEMKRVCKPGGTISITVPAFKFIWSRHDVVNKHYRRYIMKDIVNLFQTRNDGKITCKTYFNSILFPAISAFRLLSRILPDSLIRNGSGSDFTVLENKNFINKALFGIFSLERLLLKIFTLFIGTSILFSWRKLG